MATAVLLVVSGLALPVADDAARGEEGDSPSVALEGGYTFDLSTPWSGGARDRNTGRGLLDLGLSLDMESLAGWRGATIYVGVQSHSGRNGSEDTGDIQGYSNIDADEVDLLAEAWLEQRLFGERLRLKAGQVDANSEFAFVFAAESFINSSAGFSPTILTLPTYPDPLPGLNVFLEPSRRWRLGAAIYESASDGDGLNRGSNPSFLIGDAAVRWASGRVSLGAWHDSARFARHDGTPENGTSGWFGVFEQELVRSSEEGPAWSLFAQLGQADEEVAEIREHASVGLSAGGFSRSRPNDTLGVMITRARRGETPDSPNGIEAVLELYYGFELAPFLTLRPDLQYIADPSGLTGSEDVVVATLRVEISF